MSFVGPPFSHDLFISYSHGDVDGDGTSLLSQWSDGFVEQLRSELELFEDIGNSISIFLDQGFRRGQGIDPTEPLTDTLMEEIAATAILTVLMTPHYLSSEWCARERDWWRDAQAAHELALRGRLIVARVVPTGERPWPDLMTDRAGHAIPGRFFFNRERADIQPRPYSWPVVDSRSGGEFREALTAFVGDIVHRLRKIKAELDGRREREEERNRLSAPSGQAIYLHGRQTQEDDWSAVSTDLERNGYSVWPMGPEPADDDWRRVQDDRIRTMSGCDAVLLLGNEDERALSADLMCIGKNDRSVAIARSERTLPCGVVDTAGVVHENPDLERRARSVGIDWFDATEPPWLGRLRNWLGTAAR